MAEQRRRKLPLEGEVVDGEDDRHAAPRQMAQIGTGKPGLPVMRMHEVEAIARHQRGGGSERREAGAVILPLRPAGAEIGIAGRAKKMRRIQRQQRLASQAAGHDAGHRHLKKPGNARSGSVAACITVG